VLLGAGTFHLSSSIDLQHKGHFALRGSGASATKLVFSAATNVDCNLGASTTIGVCSTDKTDFWSGPPVFMWTGGLAQGSTTLTLSGATGIVQGSMLFLSQNDDGYTGYPATGSSVDNGDYFVCADAYATGPVTGCAYDGPDGNYPSPFNHRWQYEGAVVSGVNGDMVTIASPVRHPNWRASQAPTAMLVQPLEAAGVEDLSIDLGANPNVDYALAFGYCSGCWASGVAVENIYNWGIGVHWSIRTQIQDSYIYNGAGPDPYGMRLLTTADSLVVNNIFHKMRASLVFDEPDVGSVVAYNYSINQYYPSDAMFLAFWPHSAGDDFELYEGNISNGIVMDNSHGGHLDETMYRNFDTGWESCANGACGSATTKDFGVAATVWPFDMRYGNVVGNVFGTPGFHKAYETSAFGDCPGGACAIYSLGEANGSTMPPIPSDPLVASTMLRWANWDTVTGDARFCGGPSNTGWTTTCASTSEVPVTAAKYPNPIPTLGDTKAGQKPLPASFYYATKPAWFGDVPWPPIGPDVTGGDVGQCAGTLNTPGQFAGCAATSAAQCTGTSLMPAWGGHVNAIPAMKCYFSLGGVPDGTGGAIPFDAKSCYAAPTPPADGGVGAGPGAGGGAATSSSAGAGGGSGAGGSSHASPSKSSGCRCRIGGTGSPGGLASAAMAIVALLRLAQKRRDRRILFSRP
jgi:hypothetical protein